MSTADPPQPRRRKPTRVRDTEFLRELRERSDPRVQFQRAVQRIRQNLPGFVASVGVHVVIGVALMVLVLPRTVHQNSGTIEGGFFEVAEKLEKMMEDKPLDLPAVQTPAAEAAAPPAPARSATAAETAREDDGKVLDPSAVDVDGVLGGRGTDARGKLLDSFGGSGATEEAVGLGLEWLKRVQAKDGRWRLTETSEGGRTIAAGYPDAGQPNLKTDTGATAMALLAFLGAGHTHREGRHQKDVAAGLKWLTGQQRANGNTYDRDEEGDSQSFYAHGQAAIALCEAYAMTRDEELRGPAERAIAYICASQHTETGGWKYRPHSQGDLSVFGWQLMALQSARMAGLEIPAETLERANHFLDLVQLEDGSRYRYEHLSERPFTPAMTAEGLLCRQYLGWPKNHPAMRSGIEYLTRDEHLPNWSNGRRNVYFWYYATQVLHNVQGESWTKWNNSLRDALVLNQVQAGTQRGSWHPTAPAGDLDEYGAAGGRLYVSCLCLLTLEVYYRHLPLYKDVPAPNTGAD